MPFVGLLACLGVLLQQLVHLFFAAVLHKLAIGAEYDQRDVAIT
jgi:hypothetical protein